MAGSLHPVHKTGLPGVGGPAGKTLSLSCLKDQKDEARRKHAPWRLGVSPHGKEPERGRQTASPHGAVTQATPPNRGNAHSLTRLTSMTQRKITRHTKTPREGARSHERGGNCASPAQGDPDRGPQTGTSVR